MRVDRESLPGDAAQAYLGPEFLTGASDCERANDVAAAAHPDDEGSVGLLDALEQAQARTAAPSPQTSRISAAARSNSSSAITGVPSKGRSRSMSTQEWQP